MKELNNLDQLTNRIYHEGIEKVEKASEQIRFQAEKEKERILQDASERADQIITDAKREAERISRSTEKELQLKGKQFLSDLQYEIQHLLSRRIMETGVKGAFADGDFIKSIIMEVVRKWKNNTELELVLSSELEGKLKAAFSNSVQQYSKNLTVTFDNQVSGGFRIGVKNDVYQILIKLFAACEQQF